MHDTLHPSHHRFQTYRTSSLHVSPTHIKVQFDDGLSPEDDRWVSWPLERNRLAPLGIGGVRHPSPGTSIGIPRQSDFAALPALVLVGRVTSLDMHLVTMKPTDAGKETSLFLHLLGVALDFLVF